MYIFMTTFGLQRRTPRPCSGGLARPSEGSGAPKGALSVASVAVAVELLRFFLGGAGGCSFGWVGMMDVIKSIQELIFGRFCFFASGKLEQAFEKWL